MCGWVGERDRPRRAIRWLCIRTLGTLSSDPEWRPKLPGFLVTRGTGKLRSEAGEGPPCREARLSQSNPTLEEGGVLESCRHNTKV